MSLFWTYKVDLYVENTCNHSHKCSKSIYNTYHPLHLKNSIFQAKNRKDVLNQQKKVKERERVSYVKANDEIKKVSPGKLGKHKDSQCHLSSLLC